MRIKEEKEEKEKLKENFEEKLYKNKYKWGGW